MTPEDIVRALAAIDDPTYSNPGYDLECPLCATAPWPVPYDPERYHDTTCPWRMARLWVADNPAPLHDQEA